ncbi:hypothetical protein JL721_11723 [Aureococcus anophagefferens]|nr:hypothetical protein JL721_11723 [Aureococcus anophagefferens]
MGGDARAVRAGPVRGALGGDARGRDGPHGLDAAEAALEGRPRCVGADPGSAARAPGAGPPAEAGGARGPTARSGARRSGRAPRRAAALAARAPRRRRFMAARWGVDAGDLNWDVDPALLSEENASRIVLGMAALLEFMMEERWRHGADARRRAVFACGDGGARPTLTNLHAFLNDMARLCHYTLECNVVALILLIRFFSYQKNLRLAPATWRRYLLCALMIAQKFWDDRCLRNIDFTIAWRCVLPDAGQVDLRDVNLMERHFLAGLGYDLYIQPAKYPACLSEVLSIVVDEADPPPAAPPPTAPPPAAPPPGKQPVASAAPGGRPDADRLPPIFLIPSLCGSRLRAWSTVDCPSSPGVSITPGTDVWVAPALIAAVPGCCMSGVIDALVARGYDPTSLHAVPYDFRVAPETLATRDGYFSRLKASVEVEVARTGLRAVLYGHSMGTRVAAYFFAWLGAVGSERKRRVDRRAPLVDGAGRVRATGPREAKSGDHTVPYASLSAAHAWLGGRVDVHSVPLRNFFEDDEVMSGTYDAANRAAVFDETPVNHTLLEPRFTTFESRSSGRRTAVWEMDAVAHRDSSNHNVFLSHFLRELDVFAATAARTRRASEAPRRRATPGCPAGGMANLGDYHCVVCDNGTGFVKVGYASENFPRSIFPSMVGRPILRAEEAISDDVTLKEVMCGDEAAAVRMSLDCTYPVENGIVQDWDDMELLWNYTFYEKLGIDPKDYKIMLTEPPMNPLANRRKLVTAMFELYGYSYCNVSIQAMLTLYAQGLLTGCVVDTGDGVTHVVPVYDGFVPQNLIRRLDVAGRHVTRYLIKLLLLRGYAFNRTADFETVRQIKEKFCYVAHDIAVERRLAQETTVLEATHTLPDGRVIKIGRERFEAPEALFDPSLIDVESKGMGHMVFDMIQSADIDTRSEYYKHIVLSGGSSMYPGLPSRLERDITNRYLAEVLNGNEDRLKKFKMRIEDPPRRKHLVFLGGSVLADIMRERAEFWMTKAEYDENGIDRTLAKCR